MKTKRVLATLLLLATLTACAPTGEPSTELTVEPSATTSPVPTTVSDFDYRRYTNPQNAYYPEWAQPHSEYVYASDEYWAWFAPAARGEFVTGGYLTKEELEADPQKMASFLDYDNMTPAELHTQVRYDENGHIMTDSIVAMGVNDWYGSDISDKIARREIAELPWSEDYINMSYDEYFSIPRKVNRAWYEEAGQLDEYSLNWWSEWAEEYDINWYKLLLESGAITSQYFTGGWEPDTCVLYYTDGETICTQSAAGEDTARTLYTAEDARVLSVMGDDVVLFFMTDAYDIYRIHLPSGTLDYICSADYDYERCIAQYGRYAINYRWGRYMEFHYDETGEEPAPYEVWLRQIDIDEVVEQGKSVLIGELPVSGAFQVLSNNDVRFTVPPREDYELWDYIWEENGWFSNDTASRFVGDYVTYSAVLGKYGAPDRASLPSDEWSNRYMRVMNRMTMYEFANYFGGYPPYMSY